MEYFPAVLFKSASYIVNSARPGSPIMCVICMQKCYFHPTVPPRYYHCFLRSRGLSVLAVSVGFVALIVVELLEALSLLLTRLRAIYQYNKVAEDSPSGHWYWVALIVVELLEALSLLLARLRAIHQHNKMAARSPADHWCLDWKLAALSVLLHGILPDSLLVG